jgi:thioredoxin-related protein
MKKILFIIALIPVGFLLYNMNFSTPWLTDYEVAKKESKESGKSILLYFSGSDWCTNCMKLKKDILETEAFKGYAEEHLILMMADFPRMKKNKLDDKVIKQNEGLAEKYNPSGILPYMFLLNSEGKVLKEWKGNPNVKPEVFVEQMRKCKPKI